MEKNIQLIVAKFLVDFFYSKQFDPLNKEIHELLELHLQFAQAIAPYLEDEIRPDFLKESNEP